MRSNNWLRASGCFLAGALTVLAFAPFEYYPVVFATLSFLFYTWHKSTPKMAFWCGLAFGYGLYLVGVSWVYISLSTYGGMPLWMGSIAVLGFAGLLSLFIAVTGFLIARYLKAYLLVAVPFVWLTFEWSKSWVLTGFPWLDIGYTQTPSWLFSWAPIGGVYLVSLSVLTIAACLTAIVLGKRVVPLTLILLIFVSAWLVGEYRWSKPIGEPLTVGVVQPNVPIEMKWQLANRDSLVSNLRQLSKNLGTGLGNSDRIDLLVWPETALPLYLQHTDSQFWRDITPQGTAVLTGIMDSPSLNSGNYDEMYNAAVLVCSGSSPQVYRKRHLVPFGEYMPLRFLFAWVLEYLQLPMSDFSAWDGVQTLSCAGNINVGLSICYEDAFAGEHRANAGDSTLLVNISEDAWFGDSLASHQRLQMAQMRAKELSRPLVRSANSGPSVVIDELGTVLVKTRQFEVQSFVHRVQPQAGQTIYKRFGDWIVFLSVGVTLLIVTVCRFRRR